MRKVRVLLTRDVLVSEEAMVTVEAEDDDSEDDIKEMALETADAFGWDQFGHSVESEQAWIYDD